uniref:Fucosyltransferase n=1 Tax=Oryza meridionalis TaxID=40149 RepID=A0A0E0DYR8_9ORYZ
MCADRSTAQRSDESWREMEDQADPQLTAASKKTKGRVMTNVGKRWSWAVNAVVVALVMTMPPVVFIIIIGGGVAGAPATAVDGSDASFMHSRASHHDRLLGGLLLDGLDQESCHSRYQSAMYRRNSGRQPSSYLVSKLRRQEALQRRCGPGTAAYSNAVEQLKSGESAASPECKYMVSISYSGLGNRILAAASAFHYAVLTDRVLLIDPSNDMDELFCEPFPRHDVAAAAGLLPGYKNFSVDTAQSYGNMLKNKVIRNDDNVTPASTVAAAAQQLPGVGLFYCDNDQRLLRRVQWLVMRTDSYIVPGLFMLTGFQEELGELFPEPDTVFHHVGRYLFHPNNLVWGLVTRYYEAYLSTGKKIWWRPGVIRLPCSPDPDDCHVDKRKIECLAMHGSRRGANRTEEPTRSMAPGPVGSPSHQLISHRYLFSAAAIAADTASLIHLKDCQRVGIQVRVFGADPNSPELVEQITTCTQKQRLLPEVLAAAGDEPMTQPWSGRASANSMAVLITSLKSWCYEQIKSMYWEHAAAGGGAVSVHQPSHEEYQRFGARSHDAKAWAEMYLLSLTDVLVTTGGSTFGYVAQGLAGVRPWVMRKPWNRSAADAAPCWRDVSTEPCFHQPPYYDCRMKQWADTTDIVPHCCDVSWGLKIVNRKE